MKSDAPLRKWIRQVDVMQFISPLAIVVLVIMFASMNSTFLRVGNIADLLMNIAPLMAVAAGQMFVLQIGSIDLSVGSIASCVVVIIAVTVGDLGLLSFLIALLFGLLAGLINALLFVKLQIPSFICTLATMSFWQSMAYLIAPSSVMIPESRWYLIQWAKTFFLQIFSMPFLLSMVLVFVFHVVQRKTETGRGMTIVGANEKCARLAGIDVERIKIKAFLLSGLCSSIAGIFLLIKLRSGAPTMGEKLSLLSIAAVCLGGASLSGGKGNIGGTLLGVTLVILIQNGMTIISVDAFWQNIVFGVLIIISMYFTSDRSKSNKAVK